MFTVGIGPSSSHTVGPMRAAVGFVDNLREEGLLEQVRRVRVKLFGSLGATGRGHGTDRAVLAGLAGEHPDTVDPGLPARLMARAAAEHTLDLAAASEGRTQTITFDPISDLVMEGKRRLRFHPNALSLIAYSDDAATTELHTEVWYSVGGGFVVRDDGTGDPPMPRDTTTVPHPFRRGAELLNICAATGMSIPQVMLANEMAHGYTKGEVRAKLMKLWQVMDQSITDGCGASGELPGGLGVRRRANKLHADLMNRRSGYDPLAGLDWVSAWAIAVNEQNASGGRVVTAPTNGAAGIVPAVLKHVLTFAGPDGLRDDERLVSDFLLTAAAIGMVFQQTASISGAEVGCQGEVGVACSMAAASLAQVAGGTPQQVCNAAEIGMEHHLGLTCDPVRGLVQVPCIERNAVGAVTAITAARLALAGDGRQLVSLDEVCATMMSTGADMKDKYKETSRGGLAVNVANC